MSNNRIRKFCNIDIGQSISHQVQKQISENHCVKEMELIVIVIVIMMIIMPKTTYLITTIRIKKDTSEHVAFNSDLSDWEVQHDFGVRKSGDFDLFWMYQCYYC